MRYLLAILATLVTAHAGLDTGPLEAWIMKQKDLKSLDAEFVQQRTLPSLKKPVETAGRVRMLRPGKLLWELGSPVRTLAVTDGTVMTLAETDRKRGRRIDASSGQARQFTMLSDESFRSFESFQTTFELVESRVTDGIYQLTVRPRDRSLRSKVPWVFLDIDPRSQLLRALEMELEDKSRIRTVFTKTRINAPLDAAIFSPDFTGYRLD